MLKTRTRIPSLNTEQESVQNAGCANSKLHSKDKAGFGERAIQAEVTVEKTASPAVTSTPWDRHQEVSGDLGLPEALMLAQTMGAPAKTGHAGSLTIPGSARSCSDLPVLLSLPTATQKRHPGADRTMRCWVVLRLRWTATSCYQQLGYFFPNMPHLQKPSSKEQRQDFISILCN